MDKAGSAENTTCDCASHELVGNLQNDHSYSGKTIEMIAGEPLVFGNACYIKSDEKLWKADAVAVATMPCIYMAVATIAADAAGLFIRSGLVRDDSWGWTVGGAIYVSTTAGTLTQTAPSGDDDQIQVVGVATHADRMDFNPILTLVEAIASLANQEMFEHFITHLVDTVTMAGGSKKYNQFSITTGSLAKDGFSVLKLSTGVTDAIELFCLLSHDPSVYTFYQVDFRCKISSVVLTGEYIGVMDEPMTENDYAMMSISATPGDIAFTSRDGGGTAETTDNITVDITTEHKYTIKIKSGQCKFYVDDVLKATHTASPYTVAAGLVWLMIYETSTDRQLHLDYVNILLGRSF